MCDKLNDEQKVCFNFCPKCGASDPDVQWGDKEYSGATMYQRGDCLKCDSSFTEIYEYKFTEIDTPID